MSELPALSGREVIAALERAGFRARRIRASHHILTGPDGRICTVPVHAGRSLQKPPVRNILRQCGLTKEEFLELL